MNFRQWLLPEIKKGQKGWKTRRLELLILETMDCATQPNTGWNVWQKIKKKTPANGDEVCEAMYSLSERGYLNITGSDPDCGWFYTLVTE